MTSVYAICESTNVSECPICMDNICHEKNSIVTDCGHRFHSSCLMRHIYVNGFGCPYCRCIMTTQEEVVDVNNENMDDGTIEDEEQQEDPHDYILRGFRFFINNLNGEYHDPSDVELELEINNVESPPKPPSSLITEKLINQGVTMEDLVKVILLDHDEYDEEEEEYDILADNIWEKMRVIITNYSRMVEV